MRKDYSFPKDLRLRKYRDFQAVYQDGNRYSGRYFTYYLRKKGKKIPRIGMVASNRIGKAVRRNKVKRCIRESFRKNKDLFYHFDLIVKAKEDSPDLTKDEIRKEFLQGFKKAKKIFRSDKNGSKLEQ